MRKPLTTAFLLAMTLPPALWAAATPASCATHETAFNAKLPAGPAAVAAVAPERLIVIGFMGGRVHGDNMVHKEALVAKHLQSRFADGIHAAVFANHDAESAMKSLIQQLDVDKDGCLSASEKNAARIVLYGHSWGASETVAFARRLNEISVPVLLTVQVDSVQKPNHQDGLIPPNVVEAVNFYQTEGFLHGRSTIAAMNPKATRILGNYQSSYKDKPVACTGYPWFARTFMKAHIEIENDASVWDRIEDLIAAKVL